jgi:hypothetical protein
MEPMFCAHCAEAFTPRNRLQSYCRKTKCQRARKAAWQRIKVKTDPDYRAAKKLSQQKWAANNPGYWINYRADHPKKAERNRMLQTIRNRRRSNMTASGQVPIAKMDVSNPLRFKPIGQFYLVPLIAKLDATKVNIYTMPEPYR